MKRVLLFVAVTLAACSPSAPPASAPATSATATTAAAPSAANIPAGAYTLDKPHASFIFRLSHMSFSNFTARFAGWDAALNLDPANPAASNIVATIDPRSIETDNAPAGFLNDLRGPTWLDAAHFPQIQFRSTSVTSMEANTARVVGDLTLHGVTRPITLEATFNGGYPGMELEPHARVGFSARGTFQRSDFGIASSVLQPGSYMGVGDDVDVQIEAEFNGPALRGNR